MPEPGSRGRWSTTQAVALDRAQPVDHRELQAGPRQRAAQHQGRRTELPGDVVGHALVGGRRGGEHRRGRVELLQHVRDPAVVGAEVVAPVGDCVRLVDHQQAQPAGERVEHPPPEARVGQPLRRHEQHVELAGLRSRSMPSHSSMFEEFRVAARSPALRGRRDLVTHQRQQRRDDQRRPGPSLAGWPSPPSRPPTCPSRWPAPRAPARRPRTARPPRWPGPPAAARRDPPSP